MRIPCVQTPPPFLQEKSRGGGGGLDIGNNEHRSEETKTQVPQHLKIAFLCETSFKLLNQQELNKNDFKSELHDNLMNEVHSTIYETRAVI